MIRIATIDRRGSHRQRDSRGASMRSSVRLGDSCLVEKPAHAQRLDFFLRTIRPCGRSAHFRGFILMILKLSGGQSVKPRRMLIQQSASLEMQFTAEQFAYRAFHAREIRIIGSRFQARLSLFFRKNCLRSRHPDDVVGVSFSCGLSVSFSCGLSVSSSCERFSLDKRARRPAIPRLLARRAAHRHRKMK